MALSPSCQAKGMVERAGTCPPLEEVSAFGGRVKNGSFWFNYLGFENFKCMDFATFHFKPMDLVLKNSL